MTHERLRFPISTKELERRWSLIRKAMKKKDIDSFVVQNDNKWLGGYVRYLIDIPGEHCYPKTVFFPANDEMSVVVSGGDPLPPSPPEWAVRGVKTRVAKPYFRTLNYTSVMDAEVVAGFIKERNDKRVGLVGTAMMDLGFFQNLEKNVSGVKFIDITDMIDDIKAVKSEEELDLCRKVTLLHDTICAAMPTIIRPGKYEYQIRADILKHMYELGGEEAIVMIGSASPGSSTGQFHPFYQHRQVKAGDQVLIMLELGGPGGFYGEIARTWSLGEPPKELVDAFAVAKEAQWLAVDMIKPGAHPGDILDATNDFLTSKGYMADGRLFAHGQGYDLVERPAFRREETMRLKENMMLAVHPIALTPDRSVYAFCCDNFLLLENGVEHIHKTPQEVIVIDI